MCDDFDIVYCIIFSEGDTNGTECGRGIELNSLEDVRNLRLSAIAGGAGRNGDAHEIETMEKGFAVLIGEREAKETGEEGGGAVSMVVDMGVIEEREKEGFEGLEVVAVFVEA